MCRVFGCVAPDPVSIRHELLEAEAPVVRSGAGDDSGWGMAVYERTEGGAPRLFRFPESGDGDTERAGAVTGRIFNVHVRRATHGGQTLVNTHPFVLGNYSFGHNGTVAAHPRLLEPGVQPPAGETDSEAIFNYLMRYFDPADVPGSLRRAMSAVVARSAFSDLNFVFSDGERLYAYRLGDCELHWLAREDRLMVASENLTDEPWHTVQQDVLLTLDALDADEPHAERLLGDALVQRAEMIPDADRGAHAPRTPVAGNPALH